MFQLESVILLFAILIVSLSVHEAAHAWTADRLGDPTARMLGRITLNPLAHIDWIGTVLFPLVAIYSNLPLIGWAKPVPVNWHNLRAPRRDFAIVAAAGPISNLFLAVFNMIPVPPLDGGNVLAGLLPEAFARLIDQMRPWGFLILYALMLSGVLGTIIMPIARGIAGFLMPGLML